MELPRRERLAHYTQEPRGMLTIEVYPIGLSLPRDYQVRAARQGVSGENKRMRR